MISFQAFLVNLSRLWSVEPPPAEPVSDWPRPPLSVLAQAPDRLPQFVRDCPVAQRYLDLLGPLDWANFPERPTGRAWPGPTPHPRAPYAAAYLVKLAEEKKYMSNLRDYLVEHPALVWVLGFRLTPDPRCRHGFDVEASVPSRKQLGRVLREMNNAALQFLLDSSLRLIQAELPPEVALGQAVSLDTKHIIAWVAENNPKAYIKESDRLDKHRQPRGDQDCKLGCKRKSNQQDPKKDDQHSAPQPAQSASSKRKQANKNKDKKKEKRATQFSCDQYFWGYASGTASTKVPGYGEFVLAELTQTFDKDDTTYFFPLMGEVERRLGQRPTGGAMDAAFDAWYVYDYFDQVGGLAAVPFVERGGHPQRQFDAAGLPLCQAGLGMPCKSTYIARKNKLVPQQTGRHACPLLFPKPTGQSCPIDHPHWQKGGCTTTLGTSNGARIRHQLDRHSQAYKDLYKQRTASERINAQAKALGIERPKLRNFQAIANHNSLIYILINLQAVQRLRQMKAHQATSA